LAFILNQAVNLKSFCPFQEQFRGYLFNQNKLIAGFLDDSLIQQQQDLGHVLQNGKYASVLR
jgi:hypothetical protein